MWNKQTRRYLAAILPPLLLVLAVLVLLAVLNDGLSPGWRAALVLLLAPSYGWLGWVEYRQMLLRDELRRRLEMESLALAFIVSGGLLLMLFLLNGFKVVVVPFDAVPVVMLACYAGGQVWARLRYRYWAL